MQVMPRTFNLTAGAARDVTDTEKKEVAEKYDKLAVVRY